MSQRTDLLSQILTRNGLQHPDGRMLCKYRCTSDEFKAIEDQFKDTNLYIYSFPQNDQIFGALLCLYAAEWWRQNYSGGQWTYWGILDSLGANPDLNRQEIYDPIQGGLKYWKRPLLTVGDSNAYLVTLACEAGLPLNLLHSDKDYHFRRYLRNLLREFQIYGGEHSSATDLASRMASILPKSLRQKPLYQLCGELIENIWHLQRQIGDTDKPLEHLNDHVPRWRETLPLVVSDEAAEALLSNLVKEAITLSKINEIKISASFIITKTGYRFSRTIHLPSCFDQKSLAEMLNVQGSDVPYRLQITDCGTDEPKVICLITRRSMDGDGKFAVEVPARETLKREGCQAFQAIRLQARISEAIVDLNRIKGSMALSDLPWIFVCNVDGDPWKMIGEGSLKTKQKEVIVALNSDTSISIVEGNCVPLGLLEGSDRQIYKLLGQAIFEQDGVSSVIKTSSTEDDSSQFLLYGNLLTSGIYQTQIYKGFPRLQRSFEGGGTIQVQMEQLEWRARGVSDDWQAVSNDCIGPVQIRFSPGGEVRFIADVDIVPISCAIRFNPGANIRSGAIELKGFALEDCGLECPGGVEARKIKCNDNFRFDLSCEGQPPGSIPLYLRWHGRREISFHVPYPARGARFVGRNRRILKSEERVHISQLGGVLIQVMEPEFHHIKYIIEATVLSKEISYTSYQLKSEGPYLTKVAPGHHEFDLRLLEERCRLLFSGTEDLDAWIRIGIMSSTGDQFPQKIYIARYDLTLEPNKQTGEVSIPEDERTSFSDLVDNLQVKVFPLGTPETEEMETLSPVSQGVWQFSPQKRAKGPWLLTGWSGGWCRTRPLLWTIYQDDEGETTESLDSIESAVGAANVQERTAKIDAILKMLKDDPNHDDWGKIHAYFRLTRYLPAPTFDILKRIAKNSGVAASCLLNASEEVFDDVWTGLGRLPFDWALIPVKAWLDAAKARQKYLSRAYQEVAGVLQQPVEEMVNDNFKNFYSQSQIRFSGIKPILDLIDNMVLSKPLANTELMSMTSSEFRKVLVGYCIADPAKTLMQVHAEDYWPELPGLNSSWWPKYSEQVPEALHALWRVTPNPGYRASVLNAPVAAAFSSAFNLHMNKYFRFNIRKLREFDRNWFDSVYACTLAACIGYRIEHGMTYDDE